MSEYDDILKEVNEKIKILAKDYIPRLYEALMKEPNMTPHDAADRIKKDVAGKWSPQTISENLPEESKHAEKSHKKKDIEQSDQVVDQIVIEQSTNGNSQTIDPEFGKGVVPITSDEPVTVEPNNDQYDLLVEKYNKSQEQLEGVEADNEYLKEQISELKNAVKLLQEARPNLPSQATSNERSATTTRNPNRGFWVKFDLANLELTRPLINITNRMKDRPRYFYLEILGEEVIEVSETVLR